MSATILLILRVLLAASLFAFVGLALFLIWRDLQQQTAPAASRLPPALTLIYIADGEPVPLRFTTPEIIIGRDPSCDFTLDDSTVSAQHSRLTFRRRQWWVATNVGAAFGKQNGHIADLRQTVQEPTAADELAGQQQPQQPILAKCAGLAVEGITGQTAQFFYQR